MIILALGAFSRGVLCYWKMSLFMVGGYVIILKTILINVILIKMI